MLFPQWWSTVGCRVAKYIQIKQVLGACTAKYSGTEKYKFLKFG